MAEYTEEERERSLARLTQELQDVKAEAAQVARLEAAIRAKNAAIDNYQKLEIGQQMACYWNSYWLGYRTTAQYSEILRQRELAFATLRTALSDHAGKGWVVAKGACNEHPDGCPEGSHRLSPYEAPQPQSRNEERRYKIQGWLPPEVREQVRIHLKMAGEWTHAGHSPALRLADCGRRACNHIGAALDALKGVE